MFSKNKIKLYCDKENFYKIEMFLFSLEWNEKPFFDYVDVETQEGIYSYRIRREHDTFYLIVD